MRDMSPTPWQVPRRIDTARLTLRCYELEDVDAMNAVIPAESERLAQFVPWARSEPITKEQRAEVLAGFIREFDAQERFRFGVFDRSSGEYLGGTGLHPRLGSEALEIGYWIRSDREGRGLVREAVAAQARIALEHLGAARVEIRCAPTNVRSRRVPEALGFVLVDTRIESFGSEQRRELAEIWQFARESLPSSPVALAPAPRVITSPVQATEPA